MTTGLLPDLQQQAWARLASETKGTLTMTVAPTIQHPNTHAGQAVAADTVVDRLIQAATNPAVDPNVLERMFALAERWRKDQEKRAYASAMSRCQAELPLISKDRANPMFRSRYATLEAIVSAAAPIYTRQGFSISFDTLSGSQPGWLKVLAYVRHDDGHTEIHSAEAPLDTAGLRGGASKTGVQAFGSSSTYLRRYLIALIFNLVQADDPSDNDGNRASYDEPSPPPEPPPRAATPADWFADLAEDLRREPTEAGKISRLLAKLTPFSVGQIENLVKHEGWSTLLVNQFPTEAEAMRAAVDERLAQMRAGRDAAAKGEK